MIISSKIIPYSLLLFFCRAHKIHVRLFLEYIRFFAKINRFLEKPAKISLLALGLTELPPGVVDGIVLPIDQLADGQQGIPLTGHVVQNGRQRLRRVEGGVVE